MALTKLQLINEIKLVCPSVTDESIVIAQPEDNNGVTWYIVNIFETGASEANRKPTASRRNIHFYVHNEGELDESAYYDRDEFINSANKDVASGSNTLDAIFRIFNSSAIKSRTQAAIILAAYDVINETSATSNHDKRLLWAGDVLINSEKHLNMMVSFISLNPTILAAGGLATDNDIKYVVNSNINNAITILAL